jgi:hypothetical protein
MTEFQLSLESNKLSGKIGAAVGASTGKKNETDALWLKMKIERTGNLAHINTKIKSYLTIDSSIANTEGTSIKLV